MDLSALAQVLGAVGTIVGTAGAIWSRRAAKLSKPTGNGFAATVLNQLVQIRAEQAEQRSQINDLQSRLDGERPREQEPPRG